jgi:hypothetical protein
MGNPPTQQASAQHYVPRFSLKDFTEKQGVLWVYERFKATFSRTAKAPHFHVSYAEAALAWEAVPPPVAAAVIFSRASPSVKVAAFCAGGNSLKVAMN